MTKPTGKGRGGARPGAGRPRIHPPKPPKEAKSEASSASAAAERVSPSIDITARAQKAALKGIKRVEGIAEHGSAMEAIKATALLLQWGFVKPEMAKAAAAADRYEAERKPEAEKPAEPKKEELGKKEIRKQNAERATESGTFEVPSAPRLLVNNG